MIIDIDPCATCVHKESRPNGDPCWKCLEFSADGGIEVSGKYYKKRIITNADKIRSMNDEELAALLVLQCTGKECPYPGPEFDNDAEVCFSCWCDWMKEEVENESVQHQDE